MDDILYTPHTLEFTAYEEYRFDSVEAINELGEQFGWSVLFRQLSATQYSGTLDVRLCGEAGIAKECYLGHLDIAGIPPSGKVAVVVRAGSDPAFCFNGENLSEDNVMLIWPEAETYVSVPESCSMYTMHFDTREFLDRMECLYPEISRGISVPGTSLYKCRPDLVDRLRPHMALTLYGGRRKGPAQKEMFLLLQDMIFEALASSVHHKKAEEYLKGSRKSIAFKARSFIDVNYNKTISLDDLCREARCGARTLERAFLETFEMPIRSYLKICRLNAAHESLVASCPASASVTDIALNAGFTHLGRFSEYYRRVFNKSPSESLRR
jgi:AraC family ethanolamine operon transcriptional activator